MAAFELRWIAAFAAAFGLILYSIVRSDRSSDSIRIDAVSVLLVFAGGAMELVLGASGSPVAGGFVVVAIASAFGLQAWKRYAKL